MSERDKIFVRNAKPEESGLIVDWSYDHLEDLRVLMYPTVEILCAENGCPICFAPVHAIALIEGLAKNPEVSDDISALALRELIHTIAFMAQKSGIKEIYFFTGPEDAKIERLAERHGFERLKWTPWRLRLEKKNDDLANFHEKHVEKHGDNQ